MNAVVDEDLHRSIGNVLSTLGFSVLDVHDYGLRGCDDREVFAFAQKHKAVLFSSDLGFSNTLTFPLGKHHGICILRFPNETSVETINTEVKSLLLRLSAGDYKGNLVILSPGKLRIRRGLGKTN